MTAGFPLELVATLACQVEGGDVRATESQSQSIIDGVLECVVCGKKYPVRHGIVRMLDEEGHLDPVGAHEQSERDKEADSYDERLKNRHHKEVVSVINMIHRDVRGKRVIEYAAGTGRFTLPVAGQASAVLAVDFSAQSLQVLARKIAQGNAKIGLVHADATTFRTKEAQYDCAISMQFIEHIQDAARRREFFRLVSETLNARGLFFLSAYHHDLRRRAYKLPQTGFHTSGVPFHYFSCRELRRELASVFPDVAVHAFDITLPLEERFGFSSELRGLLSRILEYVPVIREFGHLAYARTSKV